MRHHPHRALLHLAMLAMLVVGLGLPRWFVLCTHDNGAASLEWAHPEGSCCGGGHGGAPPDGGDPIAAPGRGCEHTSLAADIAPPPRAVDHGDLPAVAHAALPPPEPDTRLRSTTDRHAPATGPPRVDRRTELRATSLLLL